MSSYQPSKPKPCLTPGDLGLGVLRAAGSQHQGALLGALRRVIHLTDGTGDSPRPRAADDGPSEAAKPPRIEVHRHVSVESLPKCPTHVLYQFQHWTCRESDPAPSPIGDILKSRKIVVVGIAA